MDNLFGRNKRDAQSLSQLFGIGKRKHIVGAFPVELLTLDSVDVRKQQIDIILRPIVKGSAGFSNPPKQGVIVFNVRFLVRSVGVAEKQSGFRHVVQIVFKRRDIAEFTAVVRKKDRKHITEAEEIRKDLVEEHCRRNEAVPEGAVEDTEERMPE